MKKLILAVFAVSATLTAKAYDTSNGDEDERSTVATETCASESPLVLSLEKPYDVYAPYQRLSLASSNSSKSSSSYSDDNDFSGGYCEYLGLDGEDSFGIGLDFTVKYVNLGFDIYSYSTKGDIKKNEAWDLHLGARKGFRWKSLCLECSAGLTYYHSAYQEKNSKKVTDGDFGLYLNPRAVLRLWGSFGITASYRWIFCKFKFKEEYTYDYFTVGLAFLEF